MVSKAVGASPDRAAEENPKRFSLFLDGEFALGLDQSCSSTFISTKETTFPGGHPPDTTKRVASSSQRESVASDRLPSPKRGETRRRLREAGYDSSIIQPVIDDLVRVNLLNDAEFAASYARSRLIQKPISRRLMESELRAKGIPETTTAPVLETIYGVRADEELARELIQKKVRQYAGQDPLKVRKKLSDFLARRGFGWDVIREVVREGVEKGGRVVQ